MRRTALFVAASLVLPAFCHVHPAEAALAAVVKDTELKPYQEAIQGFKDTCACGTVEVDLAEGEGTDAVLSKKPDVIVAVGTGAFKKVKAVRGLPVIYLMVMPSELTSLSDNMSGVSMDISPDVYVSSTRELFPQARRIGLVYDPRFTGPFVEETTGAAGRQGLSLTTRVVHSPRDTQAALAGLRNEADILWMLPDPTVVTPETVDSILLFSFQNGAPVLTFSRKYVEMGAVAALQASPDDMGAQAGDIARKLLSGGKGPVRAYAGKYRLFINRKVAAKLGLHFSPDILKKAE